MTKFAIFLNYLLRFLYKIKEIISWMLPKLCWYFIWAKCKFLVTQRKARIKCTEFLFKITIILPDVRIWLALERCFRGSQHGLRNTLSR